MATIKYKGNVTKQQRKKVRDFVKDYYCDDLTIVLTYDWTFKPIKEKRNAKNKYSLSSWGGNSNIIGWFFGGRSTSYDVGGFRKIQRPAIFVDMNKQKWWRTFLHEFGHYIDWKENHFRWHELSRKRKEKFANDFAQQAMENEDN